MSLRLNDTKYLRDWKDNVLGGRLAWKGSKHRQLPKGILEAEEGSLRDLEEHVFSLRKPSFLYQSQTGLRNTLLGQIGRHKAPTPEKGICEI